MGGTANGRAEGVANGDWDPGDVPNGTAQGDIIFWNGSTWALLAAGVAGQHLQTQGAGADPVWVTAEEIPVSTQAASVLIGDGAGGWVEETDATIDSGGRIVAVGLTLSGDLDLNSSSPQATIGSGVGGAGIINLEKEAAGTSQIRLRTAGLIDWIIQDTPTEAFAIQRYIADVSQDTAFSIANATGDVTIANDLTLSAPAAQLDVGDDTSEPNIRIRKSAGDNGNLQYLSSGLRDWMLQNDGSEAFNIVRFIAGVVQDNAISIANASGLVAVANDLTVNGSTITLGDANAILVQGDATGGVTKQMRKGAASVATFQMMTGSSDAANDKKIVLDASEDWLFQHHNGSSWDTAIQITDADTITMLASASGTLTVTGDLTVSGDLYASSQAVIGGTSQFGGSYALEITGNTGLFSVYSVATNATAKQGEWLAQPYTNADGEWQVIGSYSDASNNSVSIGGGLNGDGATRIQFYTATALNTAYTLRGTVTSTGLLDWATDVWCREVSVDGDSGSGTINRTAITNGTDDAGGSTATVKQPTGDPLDTNTTGWIKVYVGTQEAYIPYWKPSA